MFAVAASVALHVESGRLRGKVESRKEEVTPVRQRSVGLSTSVSSASWNLR